jgi:hypothetical protein
MRLLTRIVAIVLAGFAFSASAHEKHGLVRRDWVVRGPGGEHGFVEIDMSPSASIYSEHDIETLVCAGPMHLTLHRSAPTTVVITLVPLVCLTGLVLLAVPSKRAKKR